MIIAIDPGKSGGIAWSDHNVRAEAVKMPDTPKGILDYLRYLKNIYKENPSADGCVCYLEKVGPMPKQGVTSVWTFGEHYGTLQAILLCLEIPKKDVTPAVWQKAIGATRPSVPKDATPSQKEAAKREGKHKIKSIVEARFPHLNVTLATADALGILMYAEQQNRNNN